MWLRNIRAVCSIVMDARRLADEGCNEMAVTEPCVTCTFCQSTDWSNEPQDTPWKT